MTRSKLLYALAVSLLAASAADAAPNVFWTFGFDPGYGHGSGGRAEIAVPERHASAAPRATCTASPVVLDAAAPAIAPAPCIWPPQLPYDLG